MSTITDLYNACPGAREIIDPSAGGTFDASWDDGGHSAQLAFVVPIAQQATFISTVKGTQVASGNVIQRIPLEYPYDGGLIYARAMRRTGIGADRNVSKSRPFTHCKFDIFFGTYAYPMTGDSPFRTTQIRGNSKIITIPGTYFTVAGVKLDQNIGRQVGTIEFAITKHRVADIDTSMGIIKDLMGKVNSTPFGPMNLPIGKVQLVAPESSSVTTEFGQVQNSLTLSFVYYEVGPNEIVTGSGTAAVSPPPVGSADINLALTA